MTGFDSFNMSDAEAGSKFDRTFGEANVMEGEYYLDKMRGIDRRKEMGQTIVNKAPSMGNSVGGTFTEYGMIPSFIDPNIVDRTVRETPLVAILPRRAIRGRSYTYDAITAKAGAKFLGDDSALADQKDTYTTTNIVMKYLYAVGRVTLPAQAGASGHINLLAQDIRIKSASMNEALENEIINGNLTTNSLGFQGLRSFISTNSTSNTGGDISLELIRADMNTSFEANGIIDLIVTDGSTFNVIKGLLMDYQRNIEKPSGLMDFGIPDAFVFDGALFIKDRYMPTTAGSHEILYLDTRYVFLAVLQDITFQELAPVNDSQKFYLKWYGALIVNFESAMVERTSIA